MKKLLIFENLCLASSWFRVHRIQGGRSYSREKKKTPEDPPDYRRASLLAAACARPAPGPWPSLPMPAPSSGTLASHRDPLAQLAAPHTSGDAQRAAPRAVPRPAPSLLTASRRPKGLGRIERRFVGMSWGCWVEILRGIWSPKQMSDRLRYNFNGMANGSHGNAKKGMKYKLWCQVRAVFGWG